MRRRVLAFSAALAFLVLLIGVWPVPPGTSPLLTYVEPVCTQSRPGYVGGSWCISSWTVKSLGKAPPRPGLGGAPPDPWYVQINLTLTDGRSVSVYGEVSNGSALLTSTPYDPGSTRTTLQIGQDVQPFAGGLWFSMTHEYFVIIRESIS